VLPDSSRSRLHAVLGNPRHRPDVVMFTSSSTVTNFSALLGAKGRGRAHLGHIALLHEIRFASIGPVTSSRLRELGLPVHIEAKEYTIIGLIQAIVDHFHTSPQQSQVT
jgi:uroporphyrinogen-III synthase